MSIDAMKTALEALESDNPDIQLRAAITLRLAIEQAEQEPQERYTFGTPLLDRFTKPQEKQEPCGRLVSDPYDGHRFIPRIKDDWSMLGLDLYTAPPQRKPESLCICELTCVCGAVWQGEELVSAPPQRQPLTEKELDQIYQAHHNKYGHPEGPAWAYERAIERKHGIGGGE